MYGNFDDLSIVEGLQWLALRLSSSQQPTRRLCLHPHRRLDRCNSDCTTHWRRCC